MKRLALGLALLSACGLPEGAQSPATARALTVSEVTWNPTHAPTGAILDVADVGSLFDSLDDLLASASVGKVDGETATTIDVDGKDLVLLGYNINKDKNVADHFILDV